MPNTPPGYSPPWFPRLGRPRTGVPVTATIPPPPVEIPLCWLTGPVALRLEHPLNTALVSRPGGADGTAINRASIAESGSWPFTATIYSPIHADASGLAAWTVAYQADPRMRAPNLIVDLMYRTDDECIMLRRIERNSRILLAGVPPEFPEGASSLIVTGITNELGLAVRRINFTTTYVVGTVPGEPGPWFRLDSSELDGTDVMIF